MAHVLNIIHGNTTITLASSNKFLLDYVPQVAARRDTSVVETATVMFTGSTISDVQTTVQSIEKAFELAERRADTGRGDRVYISFQPSGYAAAYRSELVREAPGAPIGRVVLPEKSLGWRWAALNFEAQIIWTRRAYWEASSEAELSLANGGGSGTGGRAIYNMHTSAVFSDTTVSFTASDTIADSGSGFGIFGVGDVISLRGSTSNDGIYTVATAAAGSITVNEPVVNEAAGDSVSIYDIQNYVEIDSANISGDVPAAVRIELTNDDAGASLETCWIGHSVLATHAQFAHILEAEDSDTGSDTGDATSSSGFKRQYSVGTSEAKVTGWTIDSATVTAADSGFFKVLARFAAGTNVVDVKWRLKLLYSGSVIWSGGQVQFDDTYEAIARLIREIDTIQLPPYPLEGGTPTGLTLELWGESTSGGAETINLDCLIMLPVDGYHKLVSTDGIAQNSILKDDGILGIQYQSVSSEQVRDIATSGDGILVWPGEDNRIYIVLHSVTANTADHNRSASVRVYYRPRRLTL